MKRASLLDAPPTPEPESPAADLTDRLLERKKERFAGRRTEDGGRTLRGPPALRIQFAQIRGFSRRSPWSIPLPPYSLSPFP